MEDPLLNEFEHMDDNPVRLMPPVPWRPSTHRALHREETAKSLFHGAKVQFEQQLTGKGKHILEDIVPPMYHLTSHTWSTFRRWVENNHPGWKAKRRGKNFALPQNLLFQQINDHELSQICL